MQNQNSCAKDAFYKRKCTNENSICVLIVLRVFITFTWRLPSRMGVLLLIGFLPNNHGVLCVGNLSLHFVLPLHVFIYVGKRLNDSRETLMTGINMGPVTSWLGQKIYLYMIATNVLVQPQIWLITALLSTHFSLCLKWVIFLAWFLLYGVPYFFQFFGPSIIWYIWYSGRFLSFLCNRYLIFLLSLLWQSWGPYCIVSCHIFLIWSIRECFVF